MHITSQIRHAHARSTCELHDKKCLPKNDGFKTWRVFFGFNNPKKSFISFGIVYAFNLKYQVFNPSDHSRVTD